MSFLYNYVTADPKVEEELGPPPLPPKEKDKLKKHNTASTADRPPPRPPHDSKPAAKKSHTTTDTFKKMESGSDHSLKAPISSDNSLSAPVALPRPQSTSSLLYNVNSSTLAPGNFGSNIDIVVGLKGAHISSTQDNVPFYRLDSRENQYGGLKPSSSTGSLLKMHESAVTLREQISRDKTSQIPSLGSNGSASDLGAGLNDEIIEKSKSFGHVAIPSTNSRSPSPGRRSPSTRRQFSTGSNAKSSKKSLSSFMQNLTHNASPGSQNKGLSGSRNSSSRSLNCLQTCVSVIGARRSGKTSLCRRFAQGTFEELYDPTFTFETYTRTITLGTGRSATNVDVKVLDTAVESVPLKESRPFLEEADGIMLVYSVTSVESAKALEGLLDIIYAWSGVDGMSNLPILVVATQSDGIAGKPFQQTEITRESLKIGQHFAEINDLPHLETTALSPRTTEVFSHLIRQTLTTR